MLRTALLALVLGFGTPHFGDFSELFTSVRAADTVEAGGGWDPWGSGEWAEYGTSYDPNGSSGDRGVGWDPNG
jgi:hypothetical protein